MVLCLLGIGIAIFLYYKSCDHFNPFYHEWSRPISRTIEESKERGAFICEYEVDFVSCPPFSKEGGSLKIENAWTEFRWDYEGRCGTKYEFDRPRLVIRFEPDVIPLYWKLRNRNSRDEVFGRKEHFLESYGSDSEGRRFQRHVLDTDGEVPDTVEFSLEYHLEENDSLRPSSEPLPGFKPALSDSIVGKLLLVRKGGLDPSLIRRLKEHDVAVGTVFRSRCP